MKKISSVQKNGLDSTHVCTVELKVSRRCTKLCVVVDIVSNFGRVECNLLNSLTRNIYESHSTTELSSEITGLLHFIDFNSKCAVLI